MPRKKKEAPNHGKYYEVKAVVGHRIDGRPIYKSFYSKISKEDARMKAQTYIIRKGRGRGNRGGVYRKIRHLRKMGGALAGGIQKADGGRNDIYPYLSVMSSRRFLLPSFGPAPADLHPPDQHHRLFRRARLSLPIGAGQMPADPPRDLRCCH